MMAPIKSLALLALVACASSSPSVRPCVAHLEPISDNSYRLALVLTNPTDEAITVRLPVPPLFRVAALVSGRYVPVERPARASRWQVAEHITFAPGASATLAADVILRFGAEARREAGEPNVWIVRNERAELDLRVLLAAPKPFHVCPLGEP